MRSQVTTKQGDGGETRALDGESYSKSHPLMECVGAVDELRAGTALLRQMVLSDNPKEHEHTAEFLLWLTHVYFLIGAACSDPLKKHPEYRKGEVSEAHLERLEHEQESLENGLRLPGAFIVCASNRLSANADVTCTLARRLERRLVGLRDATPGFDAGLIIKFVNRLSDYLYVLARSLENGDYCVVDYGRIGL